MQECTGDNPKTGVNTTANIRGSEKFINSLVYTQDEGEAICIRKHSTQTLEYHLKPLHTHYFRHAYKHLGLWRSLALRFRLF